MARVAGFTFIHNGVEGGYPFVEAIDVVRPYVDEVCVVDMQSTDETRQVLEQLDVRILEGYWDLGMAGVCLANAHAQHIDCDADVIVHFEADEIYDPRLVRWIRYHIQELGHCDILVWRIQVEQNFQRVRWYPEEVHRVFPRGSVRKVGHTTDNHQAGIQDGIWTPVTSTSPDRFLWDVTNCFRDDWLARYHNQSELWGESPTVYRWVGLHANNGFTKVIAAPDTMDRIQEFLRQPHWKWTSSFLELPRTVRPLVGVTSYRSHLVSIGLLK